MLSFAWRTVTLRRDTRCDFRQFLVDKEMRPVSNECSERADGVPGTKFHPVPRALYPFGHSSIIVFLDLTKVG